MWRTDRRTDGRTVGRTDVQPISITCFSIADARNKTREHVDCRRLYLSFCLLVNSLKCKTAKNADSYWTILKESDDKGNAWKLILAGLKRDKTNRNRPKCIVSAIRLFARCRQYVVSWTYMHTTRRHSIASSTHAEDCSALRHLANADAWIAVLARFMRNELSDPVTLTFDLGTKQYNF